jgi:cytochrome c2
MSGASQPGGWRARPRWSPSGTDRLGPSLAGVIGRRAGTAEGARCSSPMGSPGME